MSHARAMALVATARGESRDAWCRCCRPNKAAGRRAEKARIRRAFRRAERALARVSD